MQQPKLGLDIRQPGHQMVEFREDEGRKEKRAVRPGQDARALRVTPLVRKEGCQQAAGVNHDHRSSGPESGEQLVDAVGDFRIAKTAAGERNARSRAGMPEHLLADCLANQLRLREPGVTGHAPQRGLEFGRQVHRRLLHAIHPTIHPGWRRAAMPARACTGSRPFKHPPKPGRVTVPHPTKDIPVRVLRNIYRQAGLNWKER